MPFVGPVFNITSNEFYPAVEDTIIDAEAWNAVAEDLANGLTAVVTRDGAGSMSGSLNMGSNKIVSLSAATNPGDAPRFDQIQPVDATLTAIAALSFDATNNLMYSTGEDTFALLATTAAGRTALTFVDPNTDQILFWDDSEGKFTGLTLGTGLSITTTTLNLSTNLQAWSALTPGTAATKNTGTSGNNVPLLDGANTWSAKQLFTAGGFGTEIDPVNTRFIFAKWAEMSSDASGNALFANNLYANYDGSLVTYKTTQTNGFVGYAGIRFGSGFAQIARFAGATTAGATVTPTWDEVATANNTLTLAGKTLSSPTLSGTVAGSVTFSGTINLSQAGDNVMRIATTGGAQSAALELSADTSAKLWSIVAVGSGLGSDSLIFRDGGWAAGSTRFTIEATGDLVGTSVGPTSVYSLGYRGLGTLNGQNTAYTFVLTDAGRNVYHGSGTHAYQIPPNSSVAFPVGTVIEILQDGGTLTITEGSGVSLERWDGVSGTGTRTVGAKSAAVIQKVNTNNWIIMGGALT